MPIFRPIKCSGYSFSGQSSFRSPGCAHGGLRFIENFMLCLSGAREIVLPGFWVSHPVCDLCLLTLEHRILTVIRLAQWNADSSRDRAVIDSWTRAFTFSFEINFLIRVFQNFCFQLLFPPPWLFLFGVFYLWTIFSYLLLIFSYLLLLLSIIFWKLFVSIPLIVFFFGISFSEIFILTFICFQYLVSSVLRLFREYRFLFGRR